MRLAQLCDDGIFTENVWQRNYDVTSTILFVIPAKPLNKMFDVLPALAAPPSLFTSLCVAFVLSGSQNIFPSTTMFVEMESSLLDAAPCSDPQPHSSLSSKQTELQKPLSVRSIRSCSLRVVRQFHETTKKLHFTGKAEVLSRFLKHPHMKYVVDASKMQNQEISTAIVENLKSSLHIVKGVHSKDKLAAKRAALHMIANSANEIQYSDTKVAKALGIHPRNMKKFCQDTTKKDLKWAFRGRKRRQDCLSQDVVQFVLNFWKDNTRVSPGKKDVCRKRIGRKQYEEHPTHFLELTEVIVLIL